MSLTEEQQPEGLGHALRVEEDELDAARFDRPVSRAHGRIGRLARLHQPSGSTPVVRRIHPALTGWILRTTGGEGCDQRRLTCLCATWD